MTQVEREIEEYNRKAKALVAVIQVTDRKMAGRDAEIVRLQAKLAEKGKEAEVSMTSTGRTSSLGTEEMSSPKRNAGSPSREDLKTLVRGIVKEEIEKVRRSRGRETERI